MLRGKKRNVLAVYLAAPGPVFGNISLSFTGPLDDDRVKSIRDAIAKRNKLDADSIIIINIIELA